MGVIDVGDLKTQSLEEVWNGPRMRELRRVLKERRLRSDWPCATCDRLYRKRFAGVPTDHLGLFLRDNFLLRPLMLAGALRARRRRRPDGSAPTSPPRATPPSDLIQIET
jgi:hypothetical protein